MSDFNAVFLYQKYNVYKCWYLDKSVSVYTLY